MRKQRIRTKRSTAHLRGDQFRCSEPPNGQLGCHRIRVLSLLGRAPHSAATPNPSDPARSPDREWPGGTFGFVEVQPAIPSWLASVFTENGEMKSGSFTPGGAAEDFSPRRGS